MRYLKNKILIIIVAIYIFITINLTIINLTLYTNIINPIFWAGILIYIISLMKNNYIRFNINIKHIKYMTIISVISIFIYFNLGFINGFIKSQYSYNIISIIKNIFIQILPIIGIEVTRSILAIRNKNNKLILAIITMLIILAEINYKMLTNVNRQEIFRYICGNVFPIIARNSLYTYLALKGSYVLPLIYRICNIIFFLLLQILPNLDWFITGSVGILLPTIIYMLFKYLFIKERQDIRKKREQTETKISYLVTIIISILIVSFMIGLFKYEPITILSNSMTPQFTRADVIIFKKLNEEELKKIPNNSIIIYSIGDQNIAHRIVNIIKNENTVKYQTKGDRNSFPDTNLVKIDQIKGIYVFHIKYIGYPSVWLHEFLKMQSK